MQDESMTPMAAEPQHACEEDRHAERQEDGGSQTFGDSSASDQDARHRHQ